MPEKLYLLVDCHALLYRGHFAMMRNPLRAGDGTNTSGLFFLVREILERKESRGSDVVAAVFDHPSPVFRVELYPLYKANRPGMPEELRIQSEYARKLIPALGIPLLEREGFEADDIIAWLVQQARSRGDRVEILSSDKDLLQLASPRVTVIRPGKGEKQEVVVEEEDVPEVMGVRADQVADFLALTGDPSDNIPGARGIGRKTALKLLDRYGSLERIYSSLDDISSTSVRRKLEENREMVDLSRELVSLVPAMEMDIDLEGLAMKPPDRAAAAEMLTDLGMSSILEKLGIRPAGDLFSSVQAGTRQEWCSTRIIRSLDSLSDLIVETGKEGLLAIDTETTSRDPFEAEPVGVSLSFQKRSAWYVPLAGPDALEVSRVIPLLAEKLEGKRITAQNGKYDMHILENLGLRIDRLAADPMIADYLLRPEIQSHSLSNLSTTWLERPMKEYGDVLEGAETLAEVGTEEVADYCGCDSATALELSLLLEEKLAGDPALLSIYREVELPLVRIIADMEKRGVGLDIESLGQLEEEFTSDMMDLEETAAKTAGYRINLNSPSQVSRVLFDTLGLTPVRKTASGADSSSMEVLEKLRGEHRFVDTVIEHRELSKLLNTYVRKLPGFICSRDGLIHTSFSQTVTATGRLSSSHPNLQNIPIRTSRGREIRRCFIPPGEGNVFVTADYSQIELRVLAHLAGPGNMRQAFEEERDVHSSTARAVFGDDSPGNRRKAKEVNFSILYGISPWGLSNRIGISRGDAADIIDRYVSTYPEVKSFFDSCVSFAEEHGETRTLLGRRREFSGMKTAKGAHRNSMERMAVNTTIQGSAADIIKLAMIAVDRRLRDIDGAGLVLQVHDELVAAAPMERAEEVAGIIQEEMAGAVTLDVPLVVDTGAGNNWLEAQH
ncbi:MAG: DNA polymerase I [Candidatus Aegiribacteria sp.]